jgi:deazaflavin-dependent oxidoreductase (nitroreductase family)
LPEHYQRPGWFTTHVFNRLVAALTRMGVSVVGSRVLEIKGRKSGEWRRTPVNLLRWESAEYLVAPRGHTQWVKNLRASGHGRLRVGRRVEPFTAVELTDECCARIWKSGNSRSEPSSAGSDPTHRMTSCAGSRQIILCSG